MKVGDLVRHEPKGSSEGNLKKIFEDWGWMPDFSYGVIIATKGTDAQVHYIDNNVSPGQPDVGWYKFVELRMVDERR